MVAASTARLQTPPLCPLPPMAEGGAMADELLAGGEGDAAPAAKVQKVAGIAGPSDDQPIGIYTMLQCLPFP